jgi:hypothetical protein
MRQSISSAAILRIAAATGLPYASIERMTRGLITVDRWPSRNRKVLLASDLASIINALLGQQAADAVETDTILRAFEYKSTQVFPKDSSTTRPTFIQSPALGPGTWGELLEGLIAMASPFLDYSPEAATNDTEVRCLPHTIEACLTVPIIVLEWLGPNGAPKRRDFYGPRLWKKIRQPYGPANLLVRKSFLDSAMINIAGDILRDISPPPENATPLPT